jgi:hypothetical protein
VPYKLPLGYAQPVSATKVGLNPVNRLGNPDATTLIRLTIAAREGFKEWLGDRKNRRMIPHRLERCGYVPVRNDSAKDGLWKMSGTRQVIYAKSALSIKERYTAAQRLVGR